MEHLCKHCGTNTMLHHHWDYVTFACPKCRKISSTDTAVFADEFLASQLIVFENVLQIGDIGYIEETRYEVVGVLMVRVCLVVWHEYHLRDIATGTICVLTEEEGNWALLQVANIADNGYHNASNKVLREGESIYHLLIQYNNCQVIAAMGFFERPLYRQNYHLSKYISPPAVIVVEQHPEGIKTFKGSRVKRSQLRDGFPSKTIPSNSNFDTLQPVWIDMSQLTKVFVAMVMLILFTNWGFNVQKQEQMVKLDMSLDSTYNGEKISVPFTITQKQPLYIVSYCDLTQEWIYVNIALVNRVTNEVRYLEQNMEYYYGEDWSEGSRNNYKTVCCVEPGTYHLAVMSEKSSDLHNYLSVTAYWQYPQYRNAIIACLLLLVAWGIANLILFVVEANRWKLTLNPHSAD
jgi:hypothetical protein